MTANIIIACDGLACRVHTYIGLDELDSFNDCNTLINEENDWRYDPVSGKHYCSQCNEEMKDEGGKDG